jgi:hypothetical protein
LTNSKVSCLFIFLNGSVCTKGLVVTSTTNLLLTEFTNIRKHYNNLQACLQKIQTHNTNKVIKRLGLKSLFMSLGSK